MSCDEARAPTWRMTAGSLLAVFAPIRRSQRSTSGKMFHSIAACLKGVEFPGRQFPKSWRENWPAESRNPANHGIHLYRATPLQRIALWISYRFGSRMPCGQTEWFRSSGGAKEQQEAVIKRRTVSTISLRFGAAIKRSIRPESFR